MPTVTKMKTAFKRGLPAGERVQAFGYDGVVNDDGTVTVSVPVSMVQNELDSGRLVIVADIVPSPPVSMEQGNEQENDIAPSPPRKVRV